MSHTCEIKHLSQNQHVAHPSEGCATSHFSHASYHSHHTHGCAKCDSCDEADPLSMR